MNYFQDNLLVPSSRVLRDFPKMSVNNYQSMLCNIPEKCRSQVIVSCVNHHHMILVTYLCFIVVTVSSSDCLVPMME